MDSPQTKFEQYILSGNKLIVKYLIIILTLSLIFASVHLSMLVYEKLTNPPFLVIEVGALFDIFSLVLIIAIGYELVKSLLIIISSEAIPSLPIVQIAIIAVANKIITLDVKHTDVNLLYGLAALIAGLGLTYFLQMKEKPSRI